VLKGFRVVVKGVHLFQVTEVRWTQVVRLHHAILAPVWRFLGLCSSTSNPRPNSVCRLIPLTSHGIWVFLWGVQTSSLHGSSSLRPCSVSLAGSRRGCAPDFFLRPGLAPSFGLFWEVSFWVFSWTYLGRQISQWKFILFFLRQLRGGTLPLFPCQVVLRNLLLLSVMGRLTSPQWKTCLSQPLGLLLVESLQS